MIFRVEIENIHPISKLTFELDLTQHKIHCLVGRNGAGKTTLAKAIMNLSQADTFVKTSSNGVFNPLSTIRYTLGEEVHVFAYDSDLRSISTKKPIPEYHKKIATVEMPAPHGQRFTFFRTLAEQDGEIRRSIIIGRYKKPKELIDFLTAIYQDQRFEDLVEVEFRRGVCCCIVYEDKRYLREDYFSSGEYFLISLYRKIAQRKQLVVIDEIDISLDSSTQARLAEELRKICDRYKSSVVFSSHSLALMQTLMPGEIRYFERDRIAGNTTLSDMSFNGVKSLMFGFEGYDRYILTEDERLEQFVKYVVNRYCTPTFYSYQVICAGGHGYVTSLMKLNHQYKFYGAKENVICILDGDQAGRPNREHVHCLPIENVENALWSLYKREDFPYKFEGGDTLLPKPLYGQLTRIRKILSSEEVCKLLCDHHEEIMQKFSRTLSAFLCRSND
ncbi:AAA family ATPase [Delftia tsuruhatensis]|uniref:AAA family ATPase n=1 Tax=Delftia tsuruhatensis TaxID=180282 RepID=UPI0008DF3142|nr:AAA family ATPase [Delftia tsuruhatensis]SFB61656.1 ABC-type cobalamin/Fe3+-siderophores transport system, ATPase component [Delftia tsuruhatensis]